LIIILPVFTANTSDCTPLFGLIRRDFMTLALKNDNLQEANKADTDAISRPLAMGRLTLKNRLLRSSISGRIDNYDGSGTPARVRFEERFAEGGVAAVISSHVPITPHGRVLPNYAMIDRDERIEFWRTVGERVHKHDCLFFLQLSHSGRQQDVGGVENERRLPDGVTDRPDYFNGLRSTRMTKERIREIVKMFGDAAERVVAAKLDGIELHSANGYLFTQFLSKAINDRTKEDEYGGEKIEDRARFLLEVIKEIQGRKSVGKDFPLIVKVTGRDHHNDAGLWPLRSDGNDVAEAIAVAKMVCDLGVHAIHVSTGSMFPHPLNPAGDLPVDVGRNTYQALLPTGLRTFRNYLGFRFAGRLVHWIWTRKQPFWFRGKIDHKKLEGFAATDAKAIRSALAVHVSDPSKRIPVFLTGGFQTAGGIGEVLRNESCDAVTIARPLLANVDLPRALLDGWDGPLHRPCTYCNRCLLHVIEHPLGCYDQSRFEDGPATQNGHERMMRDVFDIFADYVEPSEAKDAWKR
jgi:2,4-dienoyl-CoA reductase-like NADH-dependent reductase (Old Yellow Enzyme family)